VSILPGTPETPAGASYLTTGEAARLCAVDPRTIARWMDAGLMRSHRTGGGRRRVLRSVLLSFMRARGMPLPDRAERTDRARIAVIDDDPLVVKALLRVLARIVPGADYRSAHDGFLAGALLASFRPDLVLLDVVMPGISGVEVCEHIRSTPDLAGAAIIIVSGHLTDKLRARLATAGADRCMTKPLDPGDLRSAVLELLQSTRATSPVAGTAES